MSTAPLESTITGHEPALGGQHAAPALTGAEPMLGGHFVERHYAEHLLSLLFEPRTTHLRRAAIGDKLAELGDPRPGVGLNADGIPDIEWCYVPPGEVGLRDREKPYPVRACYIGKYPVTWAQYRVFLESPDGFGDDRWWDGLRRRPEYPRESLLIDNLPAQEVSWYDAVAYCRWLSDRLSFTVRLPNELEWEQAATGGRADILFPWGWGFGNRFANTRESGLRRATAVGMYPAGASPIGALDMGGNVFEWCANTISDPHHIEPGPELRVVRGGSWFQILTRAYTHFRSDDDPYTRFNSVGFRLAADDLEPKARPVEEATAVAFGEADAIRAAEAMPLDAIIDGLVDSYEEWEDASSPEDAKSDPDA